jgi:hypothetical protein
MQQYYPSLGLSSDNAETLCITESAKRHSTIEAQSVGMGELVQSTDVLRRKAAIPWAMVCFKGVHAG